jgi:hypothetical protein
MRTALVVLLSVAFVMSGLGLSAGAITFSSVELGLRTTLVLQGGCSLSRRTSTWAANDWDTYVVVNMRDASRGDEVVAEVAAPSGKVYRQTHAMSGIYQSVCLLILVPILGTDAEMWQGRWQGSVFINKTKVTEVSWDVTPPRPEALPEYQASLAANPANPSPRVAHYRVGAAAALAGNDDLAETELKEAYRLSPTWPYSYMALGRLYQRQGKKDLALEQFRFLKALLSRPSLGADLFTDYLQAMTEDHLKQLEP